jgi:hypothetical protein
VDRAVAWLLTRQRPRDGSWPPEPPLYHGDPQHGEYHTALAIRALAAYLERRHPRRSTEIAIPDWRNRRRAAAGVRRSLAVLAAGAAAAFGLSAFPPAPAGLLTALGATAAVLGIIGFCWDLPRRVRG